MIHFKDPIKGSKHNILSSVDFAPSESYSRPHSQLIRWLNNEDRLVRRLSEPHVLNVAPRTSVLDEVKRCSPGTLSTPYLDAHLELDSWDNSP